MLRKLLSSTTYGFMYERKHTIAHSLDPRTKLAYIAVTMVAVFLADNIIKLLIILAIQILISVFGCFYKKALHAMIGLAPFIAFLTTFDLTTAYLVEGFVIDKHVLVDVIAMVLRVIATLIALLFLIVTTSPWEMMQALSKIGIGYTHLYPFIIAYRFIPIALMEINNIYDAQRSRGLELDKGGIISRAKRLVSIIIPAVVCSLLRARDLAEAMETRGFGYSNRRSFYKELKPGIMDLLLITLYSISIAAIMLLKMPRWI